MRKFRLFSLLMSLFVIQATFAQFSISLSDLKLRPGESGTVHIAMNNPEATIQTFDFTICLPEGVSFASSTAKSVLSWEDGLSVPNGMTMSGNFDEGNLIVVGFSMEEDGYFPISTESRNILKFDVVVNADAKLTKDSKITLQTLTFGSPDNDGYEIESVSNNLIIYDIFNVSATSSDANKGTVSITPDGKQENGTSITASAKANDGYSFVNWTNAEGNEVSTDNPYTFELAAATALTANFKANQYPVVFKNDGAEVKNETIDYASVITAPKNPTKEGYTFLGWFAGETQFVEGATVPVGGITYEAKWQINQYTITFDTDGGSEIAAITQDYNTAVEAPAAPTKTGYKFVGWDKEIPATMPAENITIKATWQINQYTLSFDLNGGESEAISNITADYNSDVTKPADPTRTGYTFNGWDPEFTGKVPAANTTYVAQWTVNQYTITFDTDGGSEIDPITQDYASAITAPENPAKTGYTFKAWDKEIPANMPAENITIKAIWQINQYTVTFDSNGGTEVAPITQDYASGITAPTAPTRVGYEFAGWDKEIPATMPAEDLTLTAQWTAKKFIYKFTKKDNKDNVASDVIEIEQTFDAAVVMPTPEQLNWEGHTFDKYVETVPETVTEEGAKTFTAQYNINQYEVTFLVDGKEYKKYSLDYGSTITCPENQPTKDGWVFIGWNSDYKGETVPDFDVTYTAQWELDVVKVRFVFWDGNTKEYEYKPGAEITEIPEVPAREGYTFKGWDKEIPDVVPETGGILVITAQWSINKYAVYFIANKKTVYSAILPYGSEIVAPEAPEVEGYTFVGWTPEVDATVPARTVYYEAVYEVNTYKVTYYLNDEVVNVAEVKYGEAIPAYEPTVEEGMKFDGWQGEIPAVMPAYDLEIHGTTSGIETAIKNIVAKFGESFDVYNVSGRLVQRVNGASDISRIPAGMYIINGTKVVIRKD